VLLAYTTNGVSLTITSISLFPLLYILQRAQRYSPQSNLTSKDNTYISGIHVFRCVTPCGWVIGFRRFEYTSEKLTNTAGETS